MVVRRTAKETFPCQDSRSQHEHKFAQVPGPIRTIEMVKIMLKDSYQQRKELVLWCLRVISLSVLPPWLVWPLLLRRTMWLAPRRRQQAPAHREGRMTKKQWNIQRSELPSESKPVRVQLDYFFFKSSAIPGYCKDCKCCTFAFWSCTPLSCIMVAAMDPHAPATGSLRRTPALNRNWVPDQALEPNSKDSVLNQSSEDLVFCLGIS